MTALSHLGRIRAGLAGFCVAICLSVVATFGQTDIEQRDSQQATAAFADHVEAIIAPMPVKRELFEMRINRCEGARGEMRDDIYAVWTGARLVAEEDNAAEVLFAVLDNWRERSWEITRNRVLDNGGVNISAFDRLTGYSQSFDSGFRRHPERYIVGYFSTPCFRDPSGAAPFGPID